MVGCPGSGKSTWIKERVNKYGGAWCSRDEVRFSMVKEDEDYFSRETDVFARWIKNINKVIKDDNVTDIYVDATHISTASRHKTLRNLNLVNVDVIPVVVQTNLETCIKRNNCRTGRERVPESAINKMYNTYVKNPIDNDLMIKYKEVIYV